MPRRRETLKKVRLVDELVSQGKSVSEACRTVGISRDTYYRYKRMEKEKQEDETPPEDSPEDAEIEDEKEIEKIEKQLEKFKDTPALDSALNEIEMEDRPAHPLEQKARELLDEIRRTSSALARIQMLLSAPYMTGQPPPKGEAQGQPAPPQPQLSLEEYTDLLVKEVSLLEERRKKLKEALEKLGFKVEDMMMTKDEVEKLLEEKRREWEESALDDQRIKAVENIVNRAIDRIFGMFQPIVQAYLDMMLRGPMQSQSTQTPQTLTPQQQEAVRQLMSKIEEVKSKAKQRVEEITSMIEEASGGGGAGEEHEESG